MRATLTKLGRELGLELSGRQLWQFEQYASLLVEWNEKMNLTAITDPEEIARKHFIDSLAGWKQIAKCQNLIDVGTGAGFPGIPLKIIFPDMKLTLLDSLQKRIGFLEEVGNQLELTDVEYVHGRAEELAHDPIYREKYDAACARAVAPLNVLLEYCSGYVKEGGVFLAYKGPSLPDELQESKKAQKVLHMNVSDTILADVLGTDYQHYVAVFAKGAPIDKQYPRKQGKIKASPLT